VSSLPERIHEAAALVGGLAELARLGGFPRRSLGNWLEGRQPKPAALRKIAEVTGVGLNWLVTGEGSKFESDLGRALRITGDGVPDDQMSAEDAQEAFSRGVEASFGSDREATPPAFLPTLHDLVVLPRYEIRASAGRGALVVSENVAEHFAVGAEWLRRQLPSWAPPNAVVGILEGGGDSMEPTIRDGDLIMLVRDPPPHVIERGGIFVFTLDQDRLLLKRLQVLMNGDLSIISDNPAYVTETIPRDQIDSRVIVHGQIFFAGGRPRTLAR